MDIKNLQSKAHEDIMRLFGLEHVNIHVQNFLKDIITQSYEAGRKAEREEIVKELKPKLTSFSYQNDLIDAFCDGIQKAIDLINARNEK